MGMNRTCSDGISARNSLSLSPSSHLSVSSILIHLLERFHIPTLTHVASPSQIDLYIDRLPRLPKDHSYRCIFDRKEQTIATQTAFGLACQLPKVMLRPKIQPGRGESGCHETLWLSTCPADC